MWVVTWHLQSSTARAVFGTPTAAWFHAKKIKKRYGKSAEVEVRWESTS